jgi:membrane-bound ClpP family serine protease
LSLPQVLSAALGAASGEASGSGGARRVIANGASDGSGGPFSGVPIIALGGSSSTGLDRSQAMEGIELVNSLSLPPVPISALESAMNTLARNRGTSSTAGRAAGTENDSVDAKSGKQKGVSSEDEKKLADIYESFDFESIWAKLSQVLTRLRGDPNAAQILLPLIEVSNRSSAEGLYQS